MNEFNIAIISLALASIYTIIRVLLRTRRSRLDKMDADRIQTAIDIQNYKESKAYRIHLISIKMAS